MERAFQNPHIPHVRASSAMGQRLPFTPILKWIWLPFFLANAAVAQQTGSRTVATTPDTVPTEYQAAEATASQSNRLDLEALRAQGKKQGWKFSVGYTSAFAAPLSALTGTRVPSNFLILAAAQNQFAEKASAAVDESARLAGVPSPQYLPGCNPDDVEFNWRDKGALSEIEDQGRTCGSCWAFSAAATYNAAYKIRNQTPVKVSEQHILSCAVGNNGKPAGSCSGGWYYPAYQWMVGKGVVKQNALPYTGHDAMCPTPPPFEYRAVAWGFVTDKTSIPLNREIKQALCQYGPIASAMYATVAFQAYGGGFFNEHNKGKVNHAVTIVGLKDNAGGKDQGAWLVRNSWSTKWGDHGYAWIDYTSNNIGYAAAWVRPEELKIPVPEQALTAALQQSSVSAGDTATSAAPLGAAPMLYTYRPLKNEQQRKTVWIQYGKKSQEEAALHVRQILTKAGYFAPAVEDVSKKGTGLPSGFQVRYFSLPNQDAAMDVAKLMQKSGLGPVKVVSFPGFPQVNAIEVWFPEK
jgi:C1A family cysteine protease